MRRGLLFRYEYVRRSGKVVSLPWIVWHYLRPARKRIVLREPAGRPRADLSYEEQHDQGWHDDRSPWSTKYVEICWKCSEAWQRYMAAQPEDWEQHFWSRADGWYGPFVLAVRPEDDPVAVARNSSVSDESANSDFLAAS